jgi:hypothetical protein
MYPQVTHILLRQARRFTFDNTGFWMYHGETAMSQYKGSPATCMIPSAWPGELGFHPVLWIPCSTRQSRDFTFDNTGFGWGNINEPNCLMIPSALPGEIAHSSSTLHSSAALERHGISRGFGCTMGKLQWAKIGYLHDSIRATRCNRAFIQLLYSMRSRDRHGVSSLKRWGFGCTMGKQQWTKTDAELAMLGPQVEFHPRNQVKYSPPRWILCRTRSIYRSIHILVWIGALIREGEARIERGLSHHKLQMGIHWICVREDGSS